MVEPPGIFFNILGTINHTRELVTLRWGSRGCIGGARGGARLGLSRGEGWDWGGREREVGERKRRGDFFDFFFFNSAILNFSSCDANRDELR